MSARPVSLSHSSEFKTSSTTDHSVGPLRKLSGETKETSPPTVASPNAESMSEEKWISISGVGDEQIVLPRFRPVLVRQAGFYDESTTRRAFGKLRSGRVEC
ncbi:hypothetical protein AAMO2058_001288400 [Amorphochlora amoebiformis]